MIRQIVCFTCVCFAASVFAQPTAFTYQGLLKDGGVAADGLHDFRFRLFDAASGGMQVGTTQCVDNVVVNGGVFTTPIDFGNQFVTPAQRYIEIEVRRDTGLDCSNTSGFTALSPRQVISAAPMASHARSAFSLDAADGSRANAVIVDNNGNVGIGTAAPTHSVHIANPAPTLALQDTDSSGLSGGQQVGYISYRDSANAERAWVGFGSAGDPDFSIVNARTGGDIVLNPFGGGKVGIGTATPSATLEVRGDIRLGPVGQHLATAGDENLRVLRGNISTAGGNIGGSGWTVSHPATGVYTITYSTAFVSLPTVVACCGSNSTGSIQVMVANETSTGCMLYSRNLSNALTDASLRFIATGPR